MASTQIAPRPLPGDAGPQLGIPECRHGIGSVIATLDSAELIADVGLQPFSLWPDDRGYFLEVARLGQGMVAAFPAQSTQVSAALSYTGTIKAFHYHRHQTDLWVPAMGMFQVVLADLRLESNTFGLRNTLFVGALRPLADPDSARCSAWL